MPTYEYACRDCGEHLEIVQSFKDDPLTVCPACEGRLRKVFSAAGIVFKGSGWHVKDYGTSRAPAANGKKRDGESGDSADAGEPKPTSGSETTSTSGASEGERKTA
jgi:putative FmdB family regulatory protein